MVGKLAVLNLRRAKYNCIFIGTENGILKVRTILWLVENQSFLQQRFYCLWYLNRFDRSSCHLLLWLQEMPVFVYIEGMQMKECLFLEQIKRTIKSLWYSKLFIMDLHYITSNTICCYAHITWDWFMPINIFIINHDHICTSTQHHDHYNKLYIMSIFC